MGNTKTFDRSAGILMPVSSIPSPYGIGTFGREAYNFVDFVKNCNHKYWQVLPLGPTTYGDSPYQSFSAFAGNPYFIDLDMLVEDGLLYKSELLCRDWGDGHVPVNVSEDDALNGRYPDNRDINLGNESYVSYEKMYKARFEVLHIAFDRFRQQMDKEEQNISGNYSLENGSVNEEISKPYISENGISDNGSLNSDMPDGKIQDNTVISEYDRFIMDNKFWLSDYALFMALKDYYKGESWADWDDDIRFRTQEGLSKYRELLKNDIDFWIFVQYEFDKQWKALKGYANDNGIKIIGDIPIYMGYDSADVWANTGDFQLDENLASTDVAGVPPDAFSDLGQKWGNPLYDWDAIEANDFKWWRHRMKKSAQLYDVIRIDHFIGIVKYYAIPANMPDARQGEYHKGPGKKLTDVINESIGDKQIIAEDLGVFLPEVDELLKYNNYPGMKVLEFAFGGDRKNPHLPYNYTKDCVVYGGTHDNETLMGYFEEHNEWELGYAFDYLDTRDRERMVDNVFRAAYSSVADLVIFAVQDILKLGNWARINTPSTLGNNWKWRMNKGALTEKHINDMRYLASVFGRE